MIELTLQGSYIGNGYLLTVRTLLVTASVCMINYSCGLSLVCTMNTVRLYLSLSSGPSVSRSIYSVLQLTNNQHTVGFNWVFFVSFTRPFFLCQSSVSNLSNNTDVSSILLQEFHGGSDFQDYSVCTFRGNEITR